MSENYTLGTKYNVVGRYMKNGLTSGYHLEGLDGTQRAVTKELLIKLIRQGLIVNCRVQDVMGNPIIRGVGVNLNDLPALTNDAYSTLSSKQTTSSTMSTHKTIPSSTIFNRLTIEAKLMDGTELVGYVVRDLRSNTRKALKMDVVLRMAYEKQINNAKVHKIGDKPALIGVGCNLASLPEVQLNA